MKTVLRTLVDKVNRFAWSEINGSSDLRVAGLIICFFFVVDVLFVVFFKVSQC